MDDVKKAGISSENSPQSRAEPLGGEFNRALRGVHHLVLNTDDMKVTVDFYSGILGMPLVGAVRVKEGTDRGNPKFPNLRHYFFDMGNDSMLAFFEIPKGKKPKGDRDAIANMQHVSFSATPAVQARLKERLLAAGVDVYGPVPTSPGSTSIYFYDPNGIRLEASTAPSQGDDQAIMAFRSQTKDAARAEVATLSDDPKWVERAISGIGK